MTKQRKRIGGDCSESGLNIHLGRHNEYSVDGRHVEKVERWSLDLGSLSFLRAQSSPRVREKRGLLRGWSLELGPPGHTDGHPLGHQCTEDIGPVLELAGALQTPDDN